MVIDINIKKIIDVFKQVKKRMYMVYTHEKVNRV